MELWHVLGECNDGWQGYFDVGGSDRDAGVYVHDGDFSIENSLNGFLPIPKTEW